MTWYIIECKGGKELASERILERLGYAESFWPSFEVDRRPRGKQARSRMKAAKTVRRAEVPGYVFTCCEHIEAWRINGTHGQLWLRVLAPGGVPYRVTDEDMARMEQVPDRLARLVQAARDAERAEREAKRPKVGDTAEIKEGAFSGLSGAVVGIRYALDKGKRVEVCDLSVSVGGNVVPVTVPVAAAERAA